MDMQLHSHVLHTMSALKKEEEKKKKREMLLSTVRTSEQFLLRSRYTDGIERQITIQKLKEKL